MMTTLCSEMTTAELIQLWDSDYLRSSELRRFS